MGVGSLIVGLLHGTADGASLSCTAAEGSFLGCERVSKMEHDWAVQKRKARCLAANWVSKMALPLCSNL
jgi:hypothetical protein